MIDWTPEIAKMYADYLLDVAIMLEQVGDGHKATMFRALADLLPHLIKGVNCE